MSFRSFESVIEFLEFSEFSECSAFSAFSFFFLVFWVFHFFCVFNNGFLFKPFYVRGKNRDVILPMIVTHRLDVLLEPTKDTTLKELAFQLDEPGFTEGDESGLREASGYVFNNVSSWTLPKIKRYCN